MMNNNLNDLDIILVDLTPECMNRESIVSSVKFGIYDKEENLIYVDEDTVIFMDDATNISSVQDNIHGFLDHSWIQIYNNIRNDIKRNRKIWNRLKNKICNKLKI